MKKYKDTKIVSDPGSKSYMEDYFTFEEDKEGNIFAGVFDGHVGEKAAEYTSKKLHKVFFEKINSGDGVEKAFADSFVEISEELKNQKSGTTATVFYLKDNTLFYANVGDSRLVVFSDSGFIQLTEDHRLDNPKERERVLKEGAEISGEYVLKKDKGLMPTRTIGDQFFKDVGVTARPETGSYKVKEKDKYLLLGTDGLFDVIENQELFEFIDSDNSLDKITEKIKKEVLENRRGEDNLTFILHTI